MVLLLYNFYSLHCPLSGPDLIYISLLIIPCIIYHVTNKETLKLHEPMATKPARMGGAIWLYTLGLGTETRHQCNRYVLKPNQNADFGAMPERSIDIFVLCFSKMDVRRSSPHMTNYFPTEKMHVNSCKKALIIQIFVVMRVCMLFSHSDLKAHLGK